MEWELLLTEQVEGFLDALYEIDRETHRLVNQTILVLERNGSHPQAEHLYTTYVQERERDLGDERH